MFKYIYKLTDALKAKLSEKGQGMVEYGIVLAVVAAIAAVVFWGDEGLNQSVKGAYDSAVSNINAAKDAGTVNSGGNNGDSNQG